MDIQKLMALASRIDELDYYQLLGLQRTQQRRYPGAAIHRRARTLHPDLFFESTDEQLKVAIIGRQARDRGLPRVARR